MIYISIKQIEKGSDTSSEISLMLNNLQENYQSLDTTIYLRELEKNRMKPNKNTINNNNNKCKNKPYIGAQKKIILRLNSFFPIYETI